MKKKDTWKTIKDYDMYEVSNTGQVRNKKTGRILQQAHSNTGYTFVCLRANGVSRNKSVHRLVLETFNPRPDANKYEVNHIDYNKLNNNLENLEWVTRNDNLLHGTGPTELRVLEAMLHNAIKASLHQWYDRLLTAKCTKETFTTEVVKEAIEGATKLYNETH